jgi:hypothetical protein
MSRTIDLTGQRFGHVAALHAKDLRRGGIVTSADAHSQSHLDRILAQRAGPVAAAAQN